MGYRRIILLLVYLGIIPAVLLSLIGVMLLVLGESGRVQLLTGILILTFAGTFVTGLILAWVFLRRERNLSELQADFVSKVSHELRTPLTSIRMFTETLVLRRGDRVAEDRCIQALEKETTRLSQLINRLLDWGRMQSGMRTYTLEPTSVQEVIDEAVSAFGPTREKNEVSVTIRIEPELPPVYCDKPALVDALVNLLSNAYKYSDAPREIHVSASRVDDKLRIAVKDNGKGIPRREHKRIFEKFYRVNDLLTRKEDGSGLGLAIVHHIVRAHRGKVDVDSDLGKGSEFAIVLSTDPSKLDRLIQGAQGAPTQTERAQA